MGITFGMTVFAWIFFRADNMSHAFGYISEIVSPTLFTMPKFAGMDQAVITIILVVIFVFIEWMGREQQFAIAELGMRWRRPIRYTLYYAIVIAIFWFGGSQQQFIYFQF